MDMWWHWKKNLMFSERCWRGFDSSEMLHPPAFPWGSNQSKRRADGGITFPQKDCTIFNSRHDIASPRTQSLTCETSRQGKWQLDLDFVCQSLTSFSFPFLSSHAVRRLSINHYWHWKCLCQADLVHSCWNYAGPCSRTLLVYLFIRFARISYGRFIAIRYKFKLSTYIQEPLVICRRGWVQREIWTRKRLAADNGGEQSSKRPV
jgi:hypothetical protein